MLYKKLGDLATKYPKNMATDKSFIENAVRVSGQILKRDGRENCAGAESPQTL